MTDEQRIKLLLEAKSLGLKSITIDGVTYEFNTEVKTVKHEPVPDLDAEKLLNPMSALDDLSDTEIMYWSTPYYDTLQEQKQLREQQLKDSGELNG